MGLSKHSARVLQMSLLYSLMIKCPTADCCLCYFRFVFVNLPAESGHGCLLFFSPPNEAELKTQITFLSWLLILSGLEASDCLGRPGNR